MKINNTSDYLVDHETNIRSALAKINSNQSKIVFITNNGGELIGSLSDGDVRRWLLSETPYNDNTLATSICNTDMKYVYSRDADKISDADFGPGKSILPVVDERKRVM